MLHGWSKYLFLISFWYCCKHQPYLFLFLCPSPSSPHSDLISSAPISPFSLLHHSWPPFSFVAMSAPTLHLHFLEEGTCNIYWSKSPVLLFSGNNNFQTCPFPYKFPFSFLPNKICVHAPQFIIQPCVDGQMLHHMLVCNKSNLSYQFKTINKLEK